MTQERAPVRRVSVEHRWLRRVAPMVGVVAIAGVALPWWSAQVAFLLVASLSLLAWLGGTKPLDVHHASVTAKADGLYADDELLCARDEIAWGYVRGATGARCLVLERVSLRARLVVEAGDDADEMLRTLGLDERRAAATFRVRREEGRGWMRVLGILAVIVWFRFFQMLAPLVPHLFVPWFALGVVAGWRWSSAWRGRTVVVGIDGVSVDGEFIAHRRIRRVVRTDRGVCIALEPAGEIVLRDGAHVLDRSREDEEALAERIARACDASREATAADLPRALMRQGRTPSEWVRALREMGGHEGYRRATIARDDLLRLVEDPRAPAEARAAAAVALGAGSDDSLRARLRVAATCVAEPRVRVALEAASEQNEAGVVRALALVGE